MPNQYNIRPDANLPKANKRFLSAIIRNTDDHNKAILRAQAEAAQEVRTEREEQERKESRARADEATDAERLRRLLGGSSRRREDTWDRSRDSKRRRRSRDVHDGREDRYESDSRSHRKRRRHSRSTSRERKDSSSDQLRRRKRHEEEDKEDGSFRKHRRRSRSRSPDDKHRSNRRHEHSRRSDRRNEERESSRRPKDKGKGVESPLPLSSSLSDKLALPTSKAGNASKDSDDWTQDGSEPSTKRRSRSPRRKPSPVDLSSQFRMRRAAQASPQPPASPTLSEEEDIERLRPRRRRRASPVMSSTTKASHKDKNVRSPSPEAVSKMDKYFESSYDPRLDTGPLTVPNVPSTGLIDGSEFENWEAMLEIIRQRREDRAERKRAERLGLLPESEKDEKDGKTGKVGKASEAWTMEAGSGVMDIKYNKRGAVREWDMGKEGF